MLSGLSGSYIQLRPFFYICDKKIIMNRYKLSSVFLSILCCFVVQAQVHFLKMPEEKQFFPRDKVSGLATAVISGWVDNAGVSYSSIKVLAYRNNILRKEEEKTLIYQNGLAPFQFSATIKAELASFRLEVYGVANQVSTLLASASNLVAGDAFLIQGQSNAEASSYRGKTDSLESNFIRSYGTGNENGTTDKWYVASGDGDRQSPGHLGQWGLTIARKIVDNYKIPVCIINGAHGGMPISFFQRNDNNPFEQNTNYGRTLKRVTDAGLAGNIRAVYWYQGETDALLQTDTAVYKAAFKALYNDWNEDFSGIEAFYIFQIRKSCGTSEERSGKIMECQRQLALELPLTHIMASNGAQHFVDGCHFPYLEGYRFHADNIFRLMQRDIYGTSGNNNIEPPSIISASLISSAQLLLTFKNADDTYIWENGSEKDFDINGAEVSVVSGFVIGNTLLLQLSGDARNAISIDYFGHQGGSTPFLKNLNGIGMIGFWEFPIVGQHRMMQNKVKQVHLQVTH
jgi:hypothetical protein